MRKILILANNDVGLYKFRRMLIEQLLLSCSVYISLPYGKYVDKLESMGCSFIDTSVDRRGMNIKKDLALLCKYYKIIRKIKPDQIISYTIKPNIYGGLVSRILRIQFAANITGLGTVFQKKSFLLYLIKKIYKFSLKKAIVVFFENSHNFNIFINENIILKSQGIILNGAGVNTDEYEYVTYPNNKDAYNMLFIGRIMEEKGIKELFQVARKIKKNYQNVNFNIVGLYEDDLEKEIMKLIADNVINYYGFQDNVKPFISKAHCIILPSYHEGMSNVLLEAGAMGRPIIASDIPGCKEAILNEESGYLVKVKDKDDLYNKVSSFLDLPNEIKEEMGIKGFNHIRKHFDKKKIVRNTLKRLTV